MCHANPSNFNNLDNIKNGGFAIIDSNWKFGASPFHGYIRFMECCLHISYRLEFEQWKRTGVNIQLSKIKQRQVQAGRKDRMGLRVDFPKPGGSGTSNDGNTARRDFAKYQTLASVLGIDKQLAKNFRTILLALNCQLPLRSEASGQLCKSTAEIFVRNYPWYPMPASVHKILIHGQVIVENACLPVGFLGEDAGESKNKKNKEYRKEKNSDLHPCIVAATFFSPFTFPSSFPPA
jgi:hypothetical protein